tara:strand:- start:1467 stop:1673 length:207 start_codon:yes stop_codon:yes gene_type:complete
MFVESCCKAYGIWERKTHRFDGNCWQRSSAYIGNILINGMDTPEQPDGCEGESMGRLGVKLEKQGSCE